MSAVLPALVEIARKEPDRLAIVWNNEEVSYRQFVVAIAALRRRLEPLGLKPGSVAAVMISHLVQAWIALITLQSLGLVTTIVRSGEELDGLDLTDVSCLVTQASELSAGLSGSAKAAELKRIVIHPFSNQELAIDVGQLELPAGGAHILSTSGTTGNYKRVLFDVEMYRARMAAFVALMGHIPPLVVYYGALGLWTLVGYNGAMGVWTHMGTVVLDQRPERYLSFKERKIDRATFTLPDLEAVLAAPEGELPYHMQLQVFVLGSAIPWSVAEKAMARLAPLILSPLGTTEVGALCLTLIRTPDDLLSHNIHPSREVEIVDESGALVPNGTVGRLRVRLQPGDNERYLDDEETTRAFFRNGYFYPGDLASIEADGRLKLHGRANDVVNVRGNKVATLPIEEAIQRRIGAKGVCVFSQPEPDGEESLHVALELDRPLADADRTNLDGLLRGWAPKIHVVESLPRNDMGKVNRIELRRQLFERSAAMA